MTNSQTEMIFHVDAPNAKQAELGKKVSMLFPPVKRSLTLLPDCAPFWTGRGGVTMGICWAGACAVRTVVMGTNILPWSTGDWVCTDRGTDHIIRSRRQNAGHRGTCG